MEKFAVDLDKVLDEFEFNEDRAEQMATILAKRNNSSGGGHMFHHPPTTCYRRPAFEPINLADADFSADPRTSTPRYNNGFSTATNCSSGPPIDLSRNTEVDWRNAYKRREDQGNNLTFQNANYSDNMHCQRNQPHISQSSDVHWQQESATNKLNVSGVFSSLNEYLSAGNTEENVTDVKNWSPPSNRSSCEENGNYTFDQTGTVGGNNMNFDQTSTSLYPSVNQEQKPEVMQCNLYEGNTLAGEAWVNTIDVCNVNENNSQTSFADLIPVTYSNSFQEENENAATSGSADETPDLLDTMIESAAPSSQREVEKDSNQSNLTQLPDVATPGRNASQGSITSDLVTSHEMKNQDDMSSDETTTEKQNVASQNEDASIPEPEPVGFSLAEDLSDAELNQYLQELEDNDIYSDVDDNQVKDEENFSAITYPEAHDKGEEDFSAGSYPEANDKDEENFSAGTYPEAHDKDTQETSQGHSSLSVDEAPSVPGFATIVKPKTISLESVICNNVNNSVQLENSETPNVTTTSKTSSAIINLVSIDCHQINKVISESTDQDVHKENENEENKCLSSKEETCRETNGKRKELTDCDNSQGCEQNTTTRIAMEMGYSEVQSCLVRMPKDGSTINVLGEEERPSRPKYLFLPSKITVENEPEGVENSEESLSLSGAIGPPGETPSVETRPGVMEPDDSGAPLSSPDVSESSSIEQAVSLQIATPLSDILSPEERSLGKLPPFWVPDADAPNCMLCDLKFTVLKRRHHCRACGKVLCSKCCGLKSRLEYMDNAEARVCQPCCTVLAKVLLVEQGESASGSPSSLNDGIGSGNNTPLGRQPNPNNPMEYCSTIPPLEQAANVLGQPPPSVLVPVGVLKREGSTRPRSDVAKQVIFSDGIRPGGDLTELDGSSEPRLPYRRPGRVLKRVGTPPGPPTASNHSGQRLLPPLDPKTMSYIPAGEKDLPPLAIITKGEIKFEDVLDQEKQVAALRSETESPAVFAINRNLFVHVKIFNLDCCVNRTCWCFSTSGMGCVGQDEIMIILECLPDETTVPKDILRHLNTIYQDASRGNTVSELGHTVFQGAPFLNSSEHGGFIYIRPSFQCLQKLIVPTSPYLVGILVHRWETPWATVFPIRLMLRLGAEYRYYPCMLVSVRNRKPVYWEIGHTIINLLADFRNLSYTLPSVRGLVIHMEDRQTSILLPKNRYDQVTRALNNSNDHVLALAANFSFQADSHLVCIQKSRDESYHTQAINIHNKPRKVTGASFVVFNGALKTTSNLTAKSSIVEDGLMVQITPDTMQALRTALRNMQDFCVGCGPSGASQPDELVSLKWVQDDNNFNIGVKSSIDGRPLDGIPSIRVHNGTDYMGTCRFIRWTEVFILQSDESSGRRGDPLDISRLSESLARATCLALIKLLDLLAQAGLTKLAVRATVHPENVGYEAGSKGEKLPPIYMDSLDNELVPVLHKAASMSQDSSAVILELIFHVMLQ